MRRAGGISPGDVRRHLRETRLDLRAGRLQVSESRWDLAETRWDLAESRWDLAESHRDLAETRWDLPETRWDLAESHRDLREAFSGGPAGRAREPVPRARGCARFRRESCINRSTQARGAAIRMPVGAAPDRDPAHHLVTLSPGHPVTLSPCPPITVSPTQGVSSCPPFLPSVNPTSTPG